MNRLEEIDELISKKWDEINVLRDEKRDIELGELNNTMFGKFWYFDNGFDVPMELSNKYVYWNHKAWLSDIDNNDYRIIIDACIMQCVITEFCDDTYLTYDMQNQLRIPYSHDVVNQIIKTAKELTIDEFKEKVAYQFDKMKDDFISSIEEEKKKS